jgi:hypothetical protein
MLHAMDNRTVTITLQVEVDGDDVRGSARASLVRADRDDGVGPATAAAAAPGVVPAAVAAVAPGVVPAAAADSAAAAADGAAAAADTGDPRVFTGWLGLIGAIDALLGFPPDAAAAARALATTQEGAPSR